MRTTIATITQKRVSLANFTFASSPPEVIKRIPDQITIMTAMGAATLSIKLIILLAKLAKVVFAPNGFWKLLPPVVELSAGITTLLGFELSAGITTLLGADPSELFIVVVVPPDLTPVVLVAAPPLCLTA